MADGRRQWGSSLILSLLLGWAMAVQAAESMAPAFPLPVCSADVTENCIAHLFVTDEDRERRTCFPARYLELWDSSVRQDIFLKRNDHYGYRRVPAAECGIPEGFLDPLKRRMAHLDPKDTSPRALRPALGIALEGGGSKSAPFALGVLAGLQQSGLLQKADVVASVSGGGYAAHYYFSRLLDAWESGKDDPNEHSDWFRDCVPAIYRCQFASEARKDVPFCPPVESASKTSDAGDTKVMPMAINETMCCEDERRQCKGDADPVGDAIFLDQPLHFTDLIYPFGSWRRAEGISDWGPSIANAGWLFFLHLLSSPPHHLAHTLFSWPENFSPSREAYRAGIERAYGHTGHSWQAAMDSGPNWVSDHAFGKELPHVCDPGWTDGAEPLRRRGSHTLVRLGCAYREVNARCSADRAGRKSCGFPLWITGTANTAGRSLKSWLVTPERDSLRVLFETTPLSQGSGTFGWVDNAFGSWLMRDAAGASAAFLDDEQRLFGKPPLRTVVSGLLHLLNANWGTDIPNYAVGGEQRITYRFMFWPLYTLPYFQGRYAPYIHLADGGNTDNLAILSLLRRGVRNIVVAASTDDRIGEFASLCEAKNQLELDGTYRLLMPELQGFGELCVTKLGVSQIKTWGESPVKAHFCKSVLGDGNTGGDCDERWDRRDEARPRGYSLWDWPVPVLKGCVVRDDGHDVAGRSCQDFQEGDVISRLYVIKPAVKLDQLSKQLKLQNSHEDGSWRSECGCAVGSGDNRSAPIRFCPTREPDGLAGNRDGETPHPMEVPCTALAFMKSNHCARDTYPLFPQHNFAVMTLNSSYTLFSAYFDLGRHYARQIRDSGNELAVPQGAGIDSIPLKEQGEDQNTDGRVMCRS